MKRLLALLLAFTMTFSISFSATALAAETSNVPSDKIIRLTDCPAGQTITIPVGDAEYIDDGNGKLIKISDLPTFSNQQEANSFISGLRNALSNPIQHDPMSEYATMSTNGNHKVASITYNYTTTIALWVEYTTSGNSNTGKVTYHNAYTTLSGYTLGVSWHEITCHSEVTSSGKDIYASATGNLVYYLLIEDLLEVGREVVNLSGYCAVIH